MKNQIFICTLILFTAVSCKSSKNSISKDIDKLEGATWELVYLTGPRISFEGLFPKERPTLIFNLEENSIGGSTSCNAYSSKITIEGNKISINDPIATMRFCKGGGEQAFTKLFSKIESYKVMNETLSFYMDDIELMRFKKQ